ncbi:GYD domain-containing protein [bacterium]|nr:MAG: GYD domain-containing protein [bacterium]
MATFAFFGSYTSDAWAHMIKNPTDRTAEIKRLIEATGAKFVAAYLMFGTDDFLIIAEGNDVEGAAAGSIVAASSGGVKALRTHQLFPMSEMPKILEKARAAVGSYQPA